MYYGDEASQCLHLRQTIQYNLRIIHLFDFLSLFFKDGQIDEVECPESGCKVHMKEQPCQQSIKCTLSKEQQITKQASAEKTLKEPVSPQIRKQKGSKATCIRDIQITYSHMNIVIFHQNYMLDTQRIQYNCQIRPQVHK